MAYIPYRRDPTKPHTDYASVLQRELDAQLYQFVKGEFQTYFMGSTNCAMLADRIIGSLGTDIPHQGNGKGGYLAESHRGGQHQPAG